MIFEFTHLIWCLIPYSSNRFHLWQVGELRDRPKNRQGSVQRGLQGRLQSQRCPSGPQKGPDLRNDGCKIKAGLYEGNTIVAGDLHFRCLP